VKEQEQQIKDNVFQKKANLNKFRAQVKRISGERSLRQHFPTSETWRGNSCAVGPGEKAAERAAGKYPANTYK